MKIQYASDLHLEFIDNERFLHDNPLKVSGDILILAGDIGYLQDYATYHFFDWASNNYKHVIIALGNHEFYNFYDISKLENGFSGSIRHNVHYYYNSVVSIDNVDIIVSTLWSHIELRDAYYIENYVNDFKRIKYDGLSLSYINFNKEHKRCYNFIKDAVKNSTAMHKIVVTHHVPSFQLSAYEFLGSKINSAFTVELFDFIEASNVDYWIYGHSHRNINLRIGNTECVTNQLGYVFVNEHFGFKHDKSFSLQHCTSQ